MFRGRACFLRFGDGDALQLTEIIIFDDYNL